MAAVKTRINNLITAHSGPSVWGESDCVILAAKLIRACGNRVIDTEGGAYPAWIRDSDGKLLSEKKAIAAARIRGEGDIAAAWEEWLEGYCRRLELAEHVERGQLAVTKGGDILVRGADMHYYTRRQWGIERHYDSQDIRSVWRVRQAR